MKFWELTSAYRSELEVLETVLKNPKWQVYNNWYQSLNRLVSAQNRTILDSEIPKELARETAAKSQQKFLYDPELKVLRKLSQHYDVGKLSQILTALEVTDRFGGHYIEEVFEYGSCRVKEDS